MSNPSIEAMLIDLDGTVYRGSDAVPGASGFIADLERRGVDYLFVTNRGNRPPQAVAAQLQAMGIACGSDRVLTSAQATAALLRGQSVFYLGETGLAEAFAEEGVSVTETAPDAVVVGYDRALTYDRLTQALRFIVAGARFVATNPDPVIALEDGLAPETGANLAALEAASGRRAEIVGKPEPQIIEAALARLSCPRERCVVLGDNLATDVAAGLRAGLRSALILTGVSTGEEAARASPAPDWIASDYGDLRRQLEGLLPRR